MLRNRAPTKTANGDIATAATTAIVVGNQDGIELDTDNKEQTSTDACDVTGKDRLNVYCFTKDQVVAAFSADMDANVTYMARSKNPDYASATVSSDGRLMITGHKPLLDEDDAPQDIKVFLKAVDSGDLPSEEHEILVSVDPMPVVGALPTSVSVKATGTATNGVIRGIIGFITAKDQDDDADEMLVPQVVLANGNGGISFTNSYFVAAIAGGNLNITGNNVTSSAQPLVILVEEPDEGTEPTQWVKHTVMVSVVANS